MTLFGPEPSTEFEMRKTISPCVIDGRADVVVREEPWAIPGRTSLVPDWDVIDGDDGCAATSPCLDRRRRNTIIKCGWGREHGDAPHWPVMVKFVDKVPKGQTARDEWIVNMRRRSP